MHIVASLISLLLLTLAFGVIGMMVMPRRAQMFEALMGRNPVALDSVTLLDSVTFLNCEPRIGFTDLRPVTKRAKLTASEAGQSGIIIPGHFTIPGHFADAQHVSGFSPVPLSLAA